MVVAVSLLVRIWREGWTLHSLPALFFSLLLVEISLRTPVPLFRLGSVHSGSDLSVKSGMGELTACASLDDLDISLFETRKSPKENIDTMGTCFMNVMLIVSDCTVEKNMLLLMTSLFIFSEIVLWCVRMKVDYLNKSV